MLIWRENFAFTSGPLLQNLKSTWNISIYPTLDEKVFETSCREQLARSRKDAAAVLEPGRVFGNFPPNL